MAEFEDQLNRILSSPDAMSQIMRMARSLSGDTEPPPPEPGPAAAPADDLPEPARDALPEHTPPAAPPGGPPDMGSPLLRRLLPVLAEGQRDTDARKVLYALRPYLNPRRQEKVERALQLARLYRLGKRFLTEREG